MRSGTNARHGPLSLSVASEELRSGARDGQRSRPWSSGPAVRLGERLQHMPRPRGRTPRPRRSEVQRHPSGVQAGNSSCRASARTTADPPDRRSHVPARGFRATASLHILLAADRRDVTGPHGNSIAIGAAHSVFSQIARLPSDLDHVCLHLRCLTATKASMTLRRCAPVDHESRRSTTDQDASPCKISGSPVRRSAP